MLNYLPFRIVSLLLILLLCSFAASYATDNISVVVWDERQEEQKEFINKINPRGSA